VDTSEPGPGTDLAIALLAMFAQMERIYSWSAPPAPARPKKPADCRPDGR
jgi:hypothetical protein